MMKPFTIATVLLVTTPAFAAKWSAVPKAVQRDIDEWESVHGKCVYWLPENHSKEEMDRLCRRDEVLRKKLERRGYGTYGHGTVGKAGKLMKEARKSEPGRRHCFQFDRHFE